MKINYIILENFSNIDTAMNAKKIKLDFRNVTNKIILLVGPNGSGKTSLLSLLTPFATIGSLDVRNGANLILPGKNGYKEIEIQDGNHTYLIKHFYTHKKEEGHSVKSYIMKDDEELNPNGNVTSFKDWVKDELHVELDYLKLIRLGSNVTSMIDLSETERKKFMNKLLEEADVFGTYFKKVNNDLRQLKVMISHAVDKQTRLGIISIEDSESKLKKLEILKENREADYDKANGTLSIERHKIEDIIDPVSLKLDVKQLEKKMMKMVTILEKGNFESNDPKYYEKKIQDLSLEKDARKNKIAANETMITNYLTFLNDIYEQKKMLAIQLQNELQKRLEEETLEETYFELGKEIGELHSKLPSETPAISLDNLSNLIIFLKNTQLASDRTYEFGKKPIRRAIALLRKNTNINSYIENNLNKIRQSQETDILLERLKQTYHFDPKDIPESCSDEGCIARRAYLAIAQLIHNEDIDITEDSAEFLQSVEFVYKNIQHIMNSFDAYTGSIAQLPDDLQKSLSKTSIYKKMEKLEPIFDEKAFQSLLTLVTDFHHLKELQDKQNEVGRLYQMVKGTNNTKSLEQQIHEMDHSIVEKQSKIKELKADSITENDCIKEIDRSLEVMEDTLETLTKFDSVSEEYQEKKEKYQLYVEAHERILSLNNILLEIKKDIEDIDSQIQTQRSNIIQYNSIQEDLTLYNQIFDEMSLVKESLSSSKGIPIRFIKNYLGNTEEITNELLDIAFGGELYIDKFKITQDEFSIPFYNHGKLLYDVKLASQGETSFISIALAFALSSQTMHEYNIMLLDEIDSTLDLQFREKFLKILENQIDRIDAEQCFFITHGNLFSSYPVDVVNFGSDDLYTGTIPIEKW